MIGIIGAMAVETDGLISIMTGIKETRVKSFLFTEGKIEGKSVVVCCCGIGKVNSATAAALMLNTFKEIDLVINLGVAGGIMPKIKQGDIVLASECVQHDYDQTADGLEKGQVPGFDFVNFTCDKETVKKAEESLKECGYTYYKGVIASGDIFVNDTKKAAAIYNEFNAFACDMESAAIAHVCHLMDCAFLSIRAISDNGDGTALMDFYTFVKEAAEKSKNVIKFLLKKL